MISVVFRIFPHPIHSSASFHLRGYKVAVCELFCVQKAKVVQQPVASDDSSLSSSEEEVQPKKAAIAAKAGGAAAAVKKKAAAAVAPASSSSDDSSDDDDQPSAAVVKKAVAAKTNATKGITAKAQSTIQDSSSDSSSVDEMRKLLKVTVLGCICRHLRDDSSSYSR